MFEMNWEIRMLMEEYFKEASEALKNSNEKILNALKDVYSKAIELTCREQCGLYMPINMFLRWVKSGFINDYDGLARAIDADGNRIGTTHCSFAHVDEMVRKGAKFIAWYNK